MAKHISIKGNKYNRLLMLELVSTNPIIYKCLCDCGNIKNIPIEQIKYGRIKSCGCLNIEKRKTTNLKHGESHSPTYNTWKNLRARCNNKNNKQYCDYGGRGIQVDITWNSFSIFLKDMGKKPGPKFQIERRNNDLGYSKSNCIWATIHTQQRNKRSNHNITYKGTTKCLTDWALSLNLSPAVLNARINKLKWDANKAFNTPLLRQNKNKNTF